MTIFNQHAMPMMSWQKTYSTQIKNNMWRWTKNCHYTWDCIMIVLSFTGSYGEDLGLCSHLRSFSTLRSITTSYLKPGSDNGLYRYLTKTLNRVSMLVGLSDWNRIAQEWAKLFDVSSLSILKTHLWHTTSVRMKLSTIWEPLYPKSLSILKSRTCRRSTKLRQLWSLEGL